MAKENQKLDKDELRDDEFVDWLVGAVQYVQDRAQAFAVGAVALVVALFAVNYFVESQELAKEEAAALLGDMLIAEQSAQSSEAIRLGEQLLTAYGGTPAAAKGAILLGNLHFSQGSIADAQRYFQLYLSDYEAVDVLVNAAQNGLAACLEAEGQYESAAQRYEEIAANRSGTSLAAMAKMNAARCYAHLGNRDKQRQLLESVIEEFPRFPVAVRARTELEML